MPRLLLHLIETLLKTELALNSSEARHSHLDDFGLCISRVYANDGGTDTIPLNYPVVATSLRTITCFEAKSRRNKDWYR